MFEEEIELQTDTNNKGENLSVMSYKAQRTHNPLKSI